MKALAKTLYGDIYNVCAMAAVLAVGAGLTAAGEAKFAWLVTPVVAMAAIGWLARR